MITGRAASSGSILGVGGEATSGTVDALADWVAGGVAREAMARLLGDDDSGGARSTGDRSAMGSVGRRYHDSGAGMGIGSSSGSHARWVGGR